MTAKSQVNHLPGGQNLLDPRRPLAAELENSIADGFLLAAVGDCIVSRPHSHLLGHNPKFTAVVDTLRGADVVFGNLETSVIDLRSFDGYPSATSEYWLVAEPSAVRDMKLLGFDILSRANNHSLDWGVEGMRETSRWLNEAGLVHAGTGETRGEAREPRFLETPKGRVGLVSIASTYTAVSPAAPPFRGAPGRPGLNPLRTTKHTVVTADMMRALAQVRDEIERERRNRDSTARPDQVSGVPQGGSPPSELTLFDTRFRLGERPGFSYEVNEIDRREFLRSVRQGKQCSDFMIAAIHAHEQGLGKEEPADFISSIARQAIDAGADEVIVSGSHLLWPIEIYRGRPIYYGLGQFFWSDIQTPVAADGYEAYREQIEAAFGDAAETTDADLLALLYGIGSGFDDARIYESVVSLSRYQDGRLHELCLYPLDLGYGKRLTQSGIPELAADDAAHRILEHLQRLSAPWGTEIAVEDGVGIIRPHD